jgi:hypothetical protein
MITFSNSVVEEETLTGRYTKGYFSFLIAYKMLNIYSFVIIRTIF